MIRLQTRLPEIYTRTTAEELAARARAAKDGLGDQVVILGHHYQRDDVIALADATGDSFGLSRFAASQRLARYVVFCGVHFMAESADVLTGDHQAVVLPDLNAGCSMADMADLDEVEQIWDELGRVTDVERVVPVTYMNSSAALKAFVGRHGGAVCTSSNARAILTWALGPRDGLVPPRPLGHRGTAGGGGDKVLFFPDQHLGRNTGFQLGFGATDMAVIDPRRPLGGLSEAAVKESTFLLWKGHCSVHQRFSTSHVDAFRTEHPDGIVIVHPECSHDVVEAADQVGSTDYIISAVAAAPPGSVVAVGTEIHLVDRLARRHASDRRVVSLDPVVCPCSTMSRIDLPHLAWVLEGLAAGEVRNRITVDPVTAAGARIALEKMLEIT
ncbi:MAG: quinolinate synthase NadA [Acidimicrobiales bacterium]